MLAHLLEKLFDIDSYSPQAKTLVVIVLIVSAYAFLSHAIEASPTHAEEIIAARSLTYHGVVRRIEPDSHNQLQVWVELYKGNVVQAYDLGHFYQEAAYNRLVSTMADGLFPYEQALPFSLPLKAQVGDSVIKKPGELLVQLVHGDSTYRFRYKCAWHSNLL